MAIFLPQHHNGPRLGHSSTNNIQYSPFPIASQNLFCSRTPRWWLSIYNLIPSHSSQCRHRSLSQKLHPPWEQKPNNCYHDSWLSHLLPPVIWNYHHQKQEWSPQGSKYGPHSTLHSDQKNGATTNLLQSTGLHMAAQYTASTTRKDSLLSNSFTSGYL